MKKYVPPAGADPGETTVFVYDAMGKLVAEYSTVVAPVEDAKVAYLTNDHLGSPRVNTNKNGNVTARHDYRPFGESVPLHREWFSMTASTFSVRAVEEKGSGMKSV